MDNLPETWFKLRPDVVYQTSQNLRVSFSLEQIKLGLKYDQASKHLRAISKGEVSARGAIGLVKSQEIGFDLKSKVLGKGGDCRFHGKFLESVLHFPGLITRH
jgi:hypothetical protein